MLIGRIIPVLIIFSCTSVFAAKPLLPIIPKPNSFELLKGNFVFSKRITIVSDAESNETKYMRDFLITKYHLNVDLANNQTPKAGKSIILEKKSVESVTDSESYQLLINKKEIRIISTSDAGLFYGIQTLIQLLPVKSGKIIALPCLVIKDKPAFRWRGMHLDVSRHFFPKDFIKKYIDYLTMYKMNIFHWHLTDDQGWRIEIKKYPRLTEIGAWRKGSMIGAYSENKFDTLTYGGYYTREDIREIVCYGTARHITIVPEIEMPGHSLAAISAYPELSCSGKKIDVGMKWGVEENVFCPSEETFKFLEDVLTEVIDMFPSKYIHIGGDEVPKEEWKKSELCQSIIKRENLKDEHELQSYFIRRIEKFVNSKGRQIIGWDEILEGGLAPNAAVMSWRGTEGGIAAAKQKHFVVMSPGGYCYFDHYQGNPRNEPLAIGGYTTIEKTYSYTPVPKELNAEEATYILGAQGNVWTEYINTPEHVEYMAIPRIAALAEVNWTDMQHRNFDDFVKRLTLHFKLLDRMKVNYAKSVFELKTTVKPGKKLSGISYEISTPFNPAGIRYTTNGTIPTLKSKKYKSPVPVQRSEIIKSAYFENGKLKGNIIEQKFYVSKSTGKKITLVDPPSEYYKGEGAFTLVNGIQGDRLKHGYDWLGWSGKNMEAVIDLGKDDSISIIKLNAVDKNESWIYLPKQVNVLVSDDGINYIGQSTIFYDEIKKQNGVIVFNLNKQKARYVKVIAECAGKIEDGMPGAGENAWLFIDEIIIE